MSDTECGCRAHSSYAGMMVGNCKYAALKASHDRAIEALKTFVRIYNHQSGRPTGQVYRPEPQEIREAREAIEQAEGLK